MAEKCALCGKEIAKYSEEINRLDLAGKKYANLCSDCVDIFLKWQQERFARMFPTAFAKRMFPSAPSNGKAP